ncbi:MAG: helix-turn-helix domain-containing protein [Saprospiraceae bacterium]|nr:helix-turn-helix domain-containing protein [Candidatus Brachybacter algidus]
MFNDLSKQATIKLNQKSLQLFIRLCDNITEELNLPDDDTKHFILKNHLHNFLLLAEREKRKQGFGDLKKGADLDYTLLFRDLLETNFTKLKAVNDYSSQLFISEKRLGQATSKVLGKTPKEIINERILLEAKRFLIYKHITIKEIGQDLGFEDPAYFVRYFKKTPKLHP